MSTKKHKSKSTTRKHGPHIRHVFGRRAVTVDGRDYTIELQADGIRIKADDRGYDALRLETIVRLAKRQGELFDKLAPGLTEKLREALSEMEIMPAAKEAQTQEAAI